MSILQHIKELLSTSFLVAEETKKEILERLPVFSEAVLVRLEDLLMEAEKKQYNFLEAAVHSNPHLANELEEIYRKGKKEERTEEEKKAIAKEKVILDQLEAILQT